MPDIKEAIKFILHALEEGRAGPDIKEVIMNDYLISSDYSDTLINLCSAPGLTSKDLESLLE
jgi:hypothetical protein